MEYKLQPESVEPVMSRMFYLAWKACGRSVGMGVFQDRGPNLTEEQVYANVLAAGDYFSNHDLPGERSADYVFGRMMKLRLNYTEDSITIPDQEPTPDYQGWCNVYKTYDNLFQAAVEQLNVRAELLSPSEA